MIRNLFCIVVAVVWTALMFPLASLSLLVTLNSSASMWVVKVPWSRVLLWAGGARLEAHGLDQVAWDRPHIFVSNHQSTIDIPVLFAALPVSFRFVAKKALMYVPFLGWYMWLARFVFVDRANHRDAVASLEKAARQVRGGISIVMFPEGTRSESRRVMRFKKGPFALAMKAGIPLVPVAIEGSGELMPKNSWNITPGPIKVMVGRPIDPTPFGDDRDALLKAVRDEVIALNRRLGGLGGASDASAAQASPSQAEANG